MKTSKPISTISYLSDKYMQAKLEELRNNKVIEFWAYVNHKPEDDESKLKPHSHLYIIPAKMLQTEDLRQELKEYDPQHPEKPLGVILFTCSKRFGDWLLYALHDKAYLATKGQSREYHYKYSDVVSSDQQTLDSMYQAIDLMEVSKYYAMLEAQEKGITWNEFFSRGTVPIQQINQWRTAWFTVAELKSQKLKRNGKTHTPTTPKEYLIDYIHSCWDRGMTDEEIYELFASTFRLYYQDGRDQKGV